MRVGTAGLRLVPDAEQRVVVRGARRRVAALPIVLAGLCALATLPAGVVAHAADKDKAAVVRPALTVTVERPRTLRIPVTLSANGTIAAWQEASVGTEANGQRLAEVLVNVGDVVRRGQVLARFAPELMRADLAQIRASVAEAEAAAADAAANAERARSLEATGALSQVQINQYVTAAATAKARLEAQRAAAQAQQLRLAQTQVLAPDDGIISARSATVGAVLPAGQEMFRLIRQGRLEWRAEVTSNELARVPPGTTATVTGASGGRVTGRVRIIAPTVDPQTRVGIVYVDLPTAAAQAATLKAGMWAKGEFDLGGVDAVTVPQQAVVVRDGYSYVFRVGPESRVAQVKVQTGRRSGERIEIASGLPADAPVVVSGAGFLNDADLVRVVAPQTAPASAVPTPAPTAPANGRPSTAIASTPAAGTR